MKRLRIGHSPDADDAFMFYALAKGLVTIEGYQIEHVMEEIEALNRRALAGELEVTAISAAAYPQVARYYRILACGASVGRNYGPAVVAKSPLRADELEGKRIAVPGQYTTAYTLLRIYLPQPFAPCFLPFDSITAAVQEGQVDAGLLIHEGQITWEQQGLFRVMDLGALWFQDTGLPIPLGLDVVHRRLGEETCRWVGRALRDAIVYARSHEDEALDYALAFGRGIERETCRRFVRMYVNEDTVDMGLEGKRALETLYRKAAERGLLSGTPALDVVWS